MARMAAAETVTVSPANNAFTALAMIGCIATLLGFIVLFIRAKELLQNGLFG